MKPLNLNIFSTRFWLYGSLIILTIWIVFWQYKNGQIDKKSARDCVREREMSYQGVVRNYSTDLFNDRSTFTLDNFTDTITIPRSQKSLYMENDDTIIKLKGQNTYILKSFRRNRIDTSQFDCN